MKIPIPENKFSENALKSLLIEDSLPGYLLWHPQTNRFMNSRNVRCNEKMVYKNLKESPEKPEIRRSEITEIPEFPKPKREKSLKKRST